MIYLRTLFCICSAACMKLEEYTTAKEAQEKGASVAPNDINLV